MKKTIIILGIILVFLTSTYQVYKKYIIEKSQYENIIELAGGDKENLSILIDIEDKRLYLINKNTRQLIKSYPIASGTEATPSPIGTWRIVNKGAWGRGFGSRWLGLNVPWGKYGIHGTNKPGSIGRNASHGCIRMLNKDIEELNKLVGFGTTVTIYGGQYGPFQRGFRVIKPGDRGSDVYAVQKIMKDKGYYPMYVDGIYGEGMKTYVIKFRRDRKLKLTHYIDEGFYNELGINLMD